jgi:hypothetical protein
MFRYGGPIKEGVMNGIREPKRNGGSMKAALVGNPMFPVGPDGRAQHNKALQYLGSKAPFLANTYNKGLANLRKIPGFFKSKMGKNVPIKSGTTTVGGKVVQTAGEGSKFVPSYLGRDPTVKLIGGTYKIVTDPRAKGYGKKAVQYGTSPSALLAGATFTDVLPGGNPFIGDRNILGQKFDKKTGIKTEGLFGRDLPAKAELEKIEADRIAKAERDEQARLEALFKTQNPDKDTTPKISADEERQNRIQKYRDIMDIKGMNKDAAYNSLIAASQAVLGADDFKGSLKDGSLISKIIGSTSQAFDKPSKTKDAIDTLILKGEIEKDISLAKGNASTQALSALSAASGKSPKFIANAKLGIANTAGEAKSQLVKLKKGIPTSDDVTAVIVSYGEDNGIPFRKQFTTEEKNEQVGKGKKFANVTELMEAAKLDPNGSDDGLYVVGTSVVEVENGIPKLRG